MKNKPVLKICLASGVTIFLLWLAMRYWPFIEKLLGLMGGAAAPLITGCVAAYAVNILMRFYESHMPRTIGRMDISRVRRFFSMMMAILSLCVIIVLLATIVLPELVSCVRLLAEEVPPAIDYLMAWLEKNALLEGDVPDFVSNWISALKMDSNAILQWLFSQMDRIVPAVVNVLSSLFSVVVSVLLAVIFAIYLLSGKEKLAAQVNSLMDVYLKPNRASRVRHVICTLDDCFHCYIVGQCVEALILGLLCVAGMLLLRFPYALMIGTMIGFTALIPIAGAYIGAGVGAFMIFTVEPVKALFFLIYIIVLQQIEGNLIYPRVVGESLKLPGIWVLAAVTIGGGVLGIGGMLLGVPLAAAAYRLLREDVEKRRAAARAAQIN